MPSVWHEFACQQCGQWVRTRRSSTVAGPKYCSQRCNGAARAGTGSGPTSNYDYYCEACGVHCTAYRSPSAQPPKYCSISCIGVAQRGDLNPSFTGGRHLATTGYVQVLAPDHPATDARGYVYEHRLVAEQMLGRLLGRTEVVHHRNLIKTDNRPENLQVLASQTEHMRIHAAIRKAEKCSTTT